MFSTFSEMSIRQYSLDYSRLNRAGENDMSIQDSIPTCLFTILVPHDQEIGKENVVQERQKTKLETQKL